MPTTSRRDAARASFAAAACAVALVLAAALPAGVSAQRGQAQGQGGANAGGAGQRGGAGAGRGGLQNPRDNATATTVGTGIISGSVILDGAGTPVRHARVTLTGAALRGGRTTTTDEGGAFNFQALPAGSFTMTASKPGYVDMIWGAKRPGRPGTPIGLADGQKVDKLVIAIPRGSVLTGVVVDEFGDPSPGTNVRAMRYVMRTGEKTLQQAGQSQTDDRGVYRIYQLQPGDYIVSAEPRNMNVGDLRQSISVEIASLTQQAQSSGAAGGGNSAAMAGALASLAGNGGAQQLLDRVTQLQTELAQVEQEQTVAYAPVYFPGTTSPASATTLTLGVGEERGSVDFRLELVPTAKIDGVVTSPDGAVPQGAQVALVSADRSLIGFPANIARVGQDGKFTFSNITPGQYTIEARATIRKADPTTAAQQAQAQQAQNGRGGFGGRGGPGGFGPGGLFGPGGQVQEVLWASADVAVSGQSIPNVALNLQPGMTVSGTIQFQGSATPPTDLTRVRVTLTTRGQQTFEIGPIPPADVDSGGHFTIPGVVPGTYSVTATVPAAGQNQQVVGTVIAGGGGNAGGGGGGGRGGGGRGGFGGGAAATGGGGLILATGTQWTLMSAMSAGRDALDYPLEIGASQEVPNLTLTFTDRTQQLSGTIQDATGQATSDYTIIVFPSDQSYWLPQARRIASTRPDTSGKFLFGQLPAGDYRLTAVTDVEPGEWYDPAFLSQIVPASIPISIGVGEKKTQDIKLAAGN